MLCGTRSRVHKCVSKAADHRLGLSEESGKIDRIEANNTMAQENHKETLRKSLTEIFHPEAVQHQRKGIDTTPLHQRICLLQTIRTRHPHQMREEEKRRRRKDQNQRGTRKSNMISQLT